MKFPHCDYAPSEDGFYSQCASCPIDASLAGCALEECGDGVYQSESETPHGGSKALFYFTDNDGNRVAKRQAHHVEVHEMNAENQIIAVLYGMVDPEGIIYLKKSSASSSNN